MRLSGIVSSGLGRASIFMAQPHYQEQFLEKVVKKTHLLEKFLLKSKLFLKQIF